MYSFKPLLTACIMAGLIAGPALAVPRDAANNGCGMWNGSMDQNWRADMRQQHQKMLHDQLKLQPKQEAAWKAFSDTMMWPKFTDKMPAANATVIERQAFMMEQMKQHQAVMQKHFEATKVFYEQLSAEQKKQFDSMMMPRSRMAKPGMRMGMMSSQPAAK